MNIALHNAIDNACTEYSATIFADNSSIKDPLNHVSIDKLLNTSVILFTTSPPLQKGFKAGMSTKGSTVHRLIIECP